MVTEHTRLGSTQRGGPRIIFFGMECSFSLPVLRVLLASDVQVCAVVLPANASLRDGAAIAPLLAPSAPLRRLPMAGSLDAESLIGLSRQHGIPVWRVRKLAARETLETLARYEPDLICVACFNAIVPRPLLDLPRLGCVNVHPSLLPDLRGPLPLFWTLREGHGIGGTTVHFMTPKLDSGAILAQEAMVVPDGIRYADLEERCAQLGGALLVRTVADLYQGRAQSVPQDEQRQRYLRYPQAEDFKIVAREWSARHSYNFIRGIAPEYGGVPVLTDTETLVVRDALKYGPGEPDERNDAGDDRGMTCMVRCRDGWVKVSGVEHYPADA